MRALYTTSPSAHNLRYVWAYKWAVTVVGFERSGNRAIIMSSDAPCNVACFEHEERRSLTFRIKIVLDKSYSPILLRLLLWSEEQDN